MTQIISAALKTAINEAKNFSPDASCVFVFKGDGEVIAQDDANPETIQEAVQAFSKITGHGDAVGGLENLTIHGSKGQVNFSACDYGFYLASVSSKEADEKSLYALNRVLVPTVIKVVDQLTQNSEFIILEKPQRKPKTPTVEVEETKAEEAALEPASASEAQQEPEKTEPAQTVEEKLEKVEEELPKTSVHQFMAEKIGGLLVASDTVRIDGEVIAGWSRLYEGKIIEQVSIETLKLKKTKCKFRAIKEKTTSSKGIVQVPERILQILELGKGELVMITPIIENYGE